MAEQEHEPETKNETEQDQEQVTSPRLEHLEETISGAKQAANEALAPQRD